MFTFASRSGHARSAAIAAASRFRRMTSSTSIFFVFNSDVSSVGELRRALTSLTSSLACGARIGAISMTLLEVSILVTSAANSSRLCRMSEGAVTSSALGGRTSVWVGRVFRLPAVMSLPLRPRNPEDDVMTSSLLAVTSLRGGSPISDALLCAASRAGLRPASCEAHNCCKS